MADNNPSDSWKERLYRSYVSSGQAGVGFDLPSIKEGLRARANFIRPVIERHMPTDRAVKILDLGCGYGAWIHFLKQAGYRDVVGVETSEEQVAAAKALGLTEVIHANAEEYLRSCAAGSFQVVVVIDLLEHFTRPELFGFMDEISRVLAPGGRIIGHVPCAEGVFSSRIRWGDLTHELAFSRDSIRQLCRTFGFAKIECFEDKPQPISLNGVGRRVIWELGTLPFRLLYLAETGNSNAIMSQNMIFVADKP